MHSVPLGCYFKDQPIFRLSASVKKLIMIKREFILSGF